MGFPGGCKIEQEVSWKVTDEHHFVTEFENLADGSVKMKAYWKSSASPDHAWDFIGSITKPAGSANSKITTCTSFMEQFGSSVFEGDDVRSMELGPHFVEAASGEW